MDIHHSTEHSERLGEASSESKVTFLVHRDGTNTLDALERTLPTMPEMLRTPSKRTARPIVARVKEPKQRATLHLINGKRAHVDSNEARNELVAPPEYWIYFWKQTWDDYQEFEYWYEDRYHVQNANSAFDVYDWAETNAHGRQWALLLQAESPGASVKILFTLAGQIVKGRRLDRGNFFSWTMSLPKPQVDSGNDLPD